MLTKINAFIGRSTSNLKDPAWLILRMLVAAMFMTHGYDKLFSENPQPFRGGGMTEINIGEVLSWPMPFELNAFFIAGSIELLAGGLILIGLWTRIAALLAFLEMAMAYAVVHLAWFPTLNGGELAFMYLLVYLAILSFGPGEYSVDAFLEMRRQEKRQKKMDAL